MFPHRRRRRHAWTFAHTWAGKYLTHNGTLGENPNGAQCVNVPNGFWATLGVPAVVGNASEWAGYQDGHRTWLPWSSELAPVVGDCVVFRVGVADPDGHVALVLDGTKTPPFSLMQNYPTGCPVQLCELLQIGVEGIIRLR